MFKHAKDSQVSITELMLPSHSNFSGKIHGGHILNLMDQIAFACASRHSRNYCVTASVNKVDFLNPIDVGELVTLKASINYTGRTSMVIGLRVESENIKTGIVKHCNSSYFTMVAKNEQGEKIFMIAQNYMPAQETQILVNQKNKQLSPWYKAEKGEIRTPEWLFHDSDLRRFKEIADFFKSLGFFYALII